MEAEAAAKRAKKEEEEYLAAKQEAEQQRLEFEVRCGNGGGFFPALQPFC